jgi:uncharacterized membrane protein HdeD (DUF308 family)
MALPLASNKNLLLKGIILFGGLGVIFMIQVFFAAHFHVMLAVGIAVIMVGLFMFINVATSRRGRWDDGDRPQRKRE